MVLGDLGRSPRMQYHAWALAEQGYAVRLIGLEGSECAPEVETHPRIQIRRLRERLGRGTGSLRAAARILDQFAQLTTTLFESVGFRAIVVQSPPAIPTLAVVWLAARRHGARWIIDWHNFSHAILAASGARRSIVGWIRLCERNLGRRADAHLCVSQAMAARLADEFAIADAAVLYDRPVQRFTTIPAADRANRADRRSALVERYLPNARTWARERRPAWLVGPTSWSDDDDIGLLLDALVSLDQRLDDDRAGSTPAIWLLLSGRGPRRAAFEARIRGLALRHVRIDSLWVSAADYPELLACADLGVCVHRSASGVDLPMKIVDLIGAGVPVCALDYGPCLAEQLRDGDGAVLFADSEQLARQLFELFADFPDKSPELDRLRNAMGALRSRTPAWRDEWRAIARPLLLDTRPSRSLRIAFFHPDFGLGGAERWLVDAALALQRGGHQVVIVTSRFDPGRCFDAARDGRLAVRVRGNLWPAAVLGRLRAPCAIARSALAVLSTALRGERYDVVCVDLVPHVIPLLGTLGRPAVVYYCHHPDQLMARAARSPDRAYEVYRAPIDRLEIRAARRADRILVNSRFTRTAVQRVYALDADEIDVLHPGIEIGPEPGACDAEGAIVLLCIGRFDPGKRFERSVAAVGILVARIDPESAARIELVIAGGYDPDQPEAAQTFAALEYQAREAGIGERVTLLRSPSDAQLRELLRRCRCLVHPTPDEHFGIAPLEAMRAGRAVVAARSGGLPETIVDAVTGLLCDADDDAFADALERLVLDVEFARALGRAGRERAISDFGVDRFGAALCALMSAASSDGPTA